MHIYIVRLIPINWEVAGGWGWKGTHWSTDSVTELLISPQEEVRRGVLRPQGVGAAAKAIPVPKVSCGSYLIIHHIHLHTLRTADTEKMGVAGVWG